MNPEFRDGDFTFPAAGPGFPGTGSDDSNSGHGETVNSAGQDILQNFPYLKQGLGHSLFSQPTSTSTAQQQIVNTFKSPFIENLHTQTTTLPYCATSTLITPGKVPSIATFTTPLSQLHEITQPYLSQISPLSSIQSTVHTPAESGVVSQPLYVPVSSNSSLIDCNKILNAYESHRHLEPYSSQSSPCEAVVTVTSTVLTQSSTTLSSSITPTPVLASIITTALSSRDVQALTSVDTPVIASVDTQTLASMDTQALVSAAVNTPIFTSSNARDNLNATDSFHYIENSSNNFINSASGIDTQQVHRSSTQAIRDSNTLVRIAKNSKDMFLSSSFDIQTQIKQEVFPEDNLNQPKIKNVIETDDNKLNVVKNVLTSVKPLDVSPEPIRFVLKGSLHREKSRYPLEVFTQSVDREEVFFDDLVYNLTRDMVKSSISENPRTSKVDNSKRLSQEREITQYTEPSIAEIRAGAVTARDAAINTDDMLTPTQEEGDESDARTDDYDAEESLTKNNSTVVKDANMNDSWYHETMMRYAEVTKNDDFYDVEMSPSIKKGGRSDPDNPFALTSPSFSESAAKALMTTTNSSTATIVMISIMSIGSRNKLIPKIINSKAAEGGIVSVVNPIDAKGKIEVKSETTPIMSKLRRDKKDGNSNETDENDTEIDRLDINIKIDDDQYVSHGDHKRWQCKLCPKSYTTKHNLVAHILDHSSIKPHLCLVCGKYFKQLSHLNTHMLTHDNVKPHVCNICHKGFTQISHLKRHETVHLVSKPYRCDICNRGFAYPSELRIHNEKHVPGKEKCVECDLEFATQKELQDHMLNDKHSNELTCRHCGRVFKFPSQLRDHLMSHVGSRPFICSECGMDFMKEHHLKAHQFTHTGLRPYTCPHCNRAFNQKANMMRHMLIHNAERAFKCHVCSKTFTQPQTLKAHMVVHAERKPYSCKFCGKQFGRQHNLQGHLHIHSDSKPYVCSICQSAFTLKGNLNRHKKVKHGLNESTENMEEDAVNFLSSLSGRANDSLVDTDQDADSRDEMTFSDSRSPKKGRKSVPRKHINREMFGDKISADNDDDDNDGSDDEESHMISYSDEERENEARMKGERSKYFETPGADNFKTKHKQNPSSRVRNDDDNCENNDTSNEETKTDADLGLGDDEVLIDENENGVSKISQGKIKKEEKVIEPERRSTRKRKRKDIMFDYGDGADVVEMKEKKKPPKGNKKGAKLDNLIATKFKNF